MPTIERNFNPEHLHLVSPEGVVSGSFGQSPEDYIRLTVQNQSREPFVVPNYRTEVDWLSRTSVFYSSLNASSEDVRDALVIQMPRSTLDININTDLELTENDYKIYRNDYDGNLYIKPNEILQRHLVPQGQYRIKLDFLNHFRPTTSTLPIIDSQYFISNIDANPYWFEEYVAPVDSFGDNMNNLVTAAIEWWNNNGRTDVANTISNWFTAGLNFDIEGKVSAFPSTIPLFHRDGYDRFVIRQISDSRKEVRLKLLDNPIEIDSPLIDTFKDKLGNPEQNLYQFDWTLGTHNGTSHTIINYMFDETPFGQTTDSQNDQSIILKLYEPLPGDIQINSIATLNKEIVVTQFQDYYYFSSIPPISVGGALPYDTEYGIDLGTIDPNTETFENYDQLTSSLASDSYNSIITGSKVDYPNLNTDFRFFENHTFFGSAKRKLENFKNKVETIQDYYSQISSSLTSITGSITIESSSAAVIAQRKNLFNKIQDEITSFTPYERFLYFDGQSESTASAPGSGKNYADTYAMRKKTSFRNNTHGTPNDSWSEFYDIKDGLPQVYKTSQSIDNISAHQFFRGDTNNVDFNYLVQRKPFFNYSGSVYLSFLIKGSDAFTQQTGSWGYRTLRHRYNGNSHNGVITPEDSIYHNTILSSSLTGSQYRRYIFQSSASYWVPTNDAPIYGNPANLDTGSGDFDAGSGKIIVLSGSMKTGSWPITTEGDYQNLATYIFPSGSTAGAPFTGSIMPSGDLFRVTAYASYIKQLSGSWHLDKQPSASIAAGEAFTSGSAITNLMLDDYSMRDNTGSIINTPTISDGLQVHGRTYGKSFFFMSESRDGIRFSGVPGDMNFTRDDNFSLSVWAKRWHSGNTTTGEQTSASDPHYGNVQPIFTRGYNVYSYGLDYTTGSNSVRARLRGASGSYHDVSYVMEDDGLNWHHYVFTYESSSATGMKLYVDGQLKSQRATSGEGWYLTGSDDFSISSSQDQSSNNEALGIGSDDITGGDPGYYNGYIQYPRVYGKKLSQQEVTKLYTVPDGLLEAELTDIRVTLNDPSDCQPFGELYHTSSAEWTSWYDGMYDSASAWDDDNINSLENNLPLYIQQSSEYDDMKQFLSLQGEQFDLIRNHIDGLTTIHNRDYNKYDSVPPNLLPTLLQNLGWDPITPFTGSLGSYFGQNELSKTPQKDIEENTWRKTLNNLLYIYKSKGTRNAINALLNVYGYPSDIIQVNEFGGPPGEAYERESYSTDNNYTGSHKITNFSPKETRINDTDLSIGVGGNISYILDKAKLYHWRSNASIAKKTDDRVINLDWWMNDANINTIEFVYKHVNSLSTQEILKSSGSGTETLWDLRLKPSSDGASSSFEFRVNNSNKGGTAIANRGYSMSLDYNVMNDGELWNVMLQRVSSSVSGSGTNQYRLYSALQDKDKIVKLGHISMSLSGGLSTGPNNQFYANQNWISSGSRHKDSSSNLFVGRTISGSMGEIRGWNSTLSASKFRMHTLDKLSTVGNLITSHRTELVYHFKLNENHNASTVSGSSQTVSVKDSAPKTSLTTDYTFDISTSITTGSLLYGYDVIDVISVPLEDTSQAQMNNNKVFINNDVNLFQNLSPFKPSVVDLTSNLSRTPKIINSTRLEISRSPQNFINNFILDKLSGHSLKQYYSDPVNRYSSSYDDLDTFRKEFFDDYSIEVDTNKFIRSQENLYNASLVDGLQKLMPARSTLSGENQSIGIVIKPTVLEKQKVEYKQHSIEVNPNLYTGSIKMIENTIHKAGNNLTSSYELPKSGSISINDIVLISSSSLELPKTGSSISLTDILLISSSKLEDPISGSSIKFFASGSSIVSLSGSEVIFPISGTNNYIPTHYTQKFRDLHSEWGRGVNDTHFLNMATENKDTGSTALGEYNVNHIERRYHFNTIGDSEVYSASHNDKSDFTNHSKFHNRQYISEFTHENTKYNSYINGNPGPQTGRMVGKTRYFYTGSDGTITLPSNHVRNFSTPFVDKMYDGTQNTNPGILSVRREDYATSSFYRVKVTGGENQLNVNDFRDGPSSINPSTNKIMR